MPDSPAIASGSRRPLVAGLACLAVAAGLGMWWFRLHSMRAGPGAETWAKGWRDNETEFLALGCAWAASGVFAVVSGILGLWSLGAWKRGRAGWIGPARVAGLDTSGPPPLRGFWTLLGIILVVACALRLPRMSLSFYNDESHNYVRLIGGDWKTFSETEKKFRTPPWSDTAFRNTSGNNGFFYSLLARCCLETWRAVSHAPTGVVREWPLRVPSLLAGLATVAGVALVLKRVGRPTAGLVASLLLAIHPWHVRYSTEARGYGLMMACLVFGLYFLVRAWRSGRWGIWERGLLRRSAANSDDAEFTLTLPPPLAGRGFC